MRRLDWRLDSRLEVKSYTTSGRRVVQELRSGRDAALIGHKILKRLVHWRKLKSFGTMSLYGFIFLNYTDFLVSFINFNLVSAAVVILLIL